MTFVEEKKKLSVNSSVGLSKTMAYKESFLQMFK